MSPLLEQGIGLASFATNVAGNLMLAKVSSRGWAVRIVSNLLWTIYAGTTAAFWLNVNHAVFFVINVYGWWQWRRLATERQSDQQGEKR